MFKKNKELCIMKENNIPNNFLQLYVWWIVERKNVSVFIEGWKDYKGSESCVHESVRVSVVCIQSHWEEGVVDLAATLVFRYVE